MLFTRLFTTKQIIGHSKTTRDARLAAGALALASVALAACGGEADPTEDLGIESRQGAIEIGVDDTSSSVRDAVVLIGGFCTGTLVAPDLVLTAGHCGFDDPTYADGEWHALPAPVAVNVGPNRTAPVHVATINAVNAVPAPMGEPASPDDIVLLRLAAAIPDTVAIPRPIYVDRPATLRSTSTISQVGYGGGRNRRIMTGSSYADWLDRPAELANNGFVYTATHRGGGVGDRGTNIEGGDSGGPMLLGGQTGPVIGVLSHWAPYGIATFGPGGRGRPSVKAWLSRWVPQRADLEVAAVSERGCTGSGGAQVAGITIRNNGAVAAMAWVDVFDGRATAPPVGTLAAPGFFRMSPLVPPAGATTMSFALPGFTGGIVHAIVDTIRALPESDEGNNVRGGSLQRVDCSFN